MKTDMSKFALLVVAVAVVGCSSSGSNEADPIVAFSLRAGTATSINMQRGDSVRLSALAVRASGLSDTVRTGLTLASTDTAVVAAHPSATVLAVGLGSGRIVGSLDVAGQALRDSVQVFVGTTVP